MKTNESNVDRIVRVVLGVLLLVLGWGGIVTGGLGIFFKWFGLLPLITGLVGFCPAYALLKVSTKK